MPRLIIGLILIGVGGFFAWEAHNVLNMEWFKLAQMMGSNAHLTSMDLQLLNSPAADLSEKLGADTYGELKTYLSIMRITGIAAVIGGLVLIAANRMPVQGKKRKKS